MKFVYTPNKDDAIAKHEESMLELYSNIIDDRYRSKFAQYNCSLNVGLQWSNFIKDLYAACRLPFRNGYQCYIYCNVERNGKVVHCADTDGEMGYNVAVASWNISSVSRCLFHLNAVLCTDTTDIAQEMEQLLKMVKESIIYTV